MTTDLIAALSAKQEELGLSNTQMAERLGISLALWSLTRRQKRPVGKQLLEGVIRQFPEFTSEALLFLRGSVATVTIPRAGENDSAEVA